MRNEDPKAAVKKRLKLLFEAIADYAAENPEFQAALERALALQASDIQDFAPRERTSSSRKPAGPNLLEVLHAGGDAALSDALTALTTDELIRLVVQEGVRKMKEAKSMERAELITLLQESARSRLRQGESFVRGGA